MSVNKLFIHCKRNPLCRFKGWFQRIAFISAYYSSSKQSISNYMDDGEQPILFATRFLDSTDVKLTTTLEQKPQALNLSCWLEKH